MSEPTHTAAGNGALLEVRGLSKSYASGDQRIRVLEALEFSLEQGELVAIVGESGIGKTTLLNLLGLMDRPDRGTYRFRGESVLSLDDESRSAFRNRRCGFVFQAHHLLPEFSAAENAAMPLWIRGLPRSEGEERAGRLLSRLGLGSRLHHRPPQLSGGERQRVAIARAFAGEPELILADEPTGDLDPVTAAGVFRLFREVHESTGVSTVLVTHNTQLAGECDRILQLREGRLEP